MFCFNKEKTKKNRTLSKTKIKKGILEAKIKEQHGHELYIIYIYPKEIHFEQYIVNSYKYYFCYKRVCEIKMNPETLRKKTILLNICNV